MSITYKPLSLVISKTNSDYNRRSLFKVYSAAPEDDVRKINLFRNAGSQTERRNRQEEPRVRPESRSVRRHVARPSIEVKKKVAETADTELTSQPRCIKSYRSDRMAIYNEQKDTFHAYSVTEAISQSGLTFQEAVDWVDERLVLVGNGMGPKNFSVAISLVLASWAMAILLISMVVRLFI
ncbi:MAG: hypothetical protein AB8G77_22600 [Rhodothermales bacterium]